MRKHLLTILFGGHLFLSLNSVQAQTVTTVKGQKVLIEIGSAELAPGDRVFTTDAKGKRRALVQIRQVKNGKASGEILKGKPEVGHGVTMGKKSDDGAGSSDRDSGGAIPARRSGSAWGFTASLITSTMKISNYVQNSTSYSFDMAGTNFGVGGFYDYPVTRDWFLRGHGTVEMFDVKKKSALAICDNSTTTDCNAKFMQLGLYGTFNYIFSPAPFRFYAGGGGGALIYVSKESTVLDTNKFFFNTILMATFGFDYFMSRTTFLPVAFEYQMIPDKEAGVTNMVVRAGWGKTF